MSLANNFEGLLRERNELKKGLVPSGAALVGTCQDMCPEFERHERELHLDLSPFEMIPGTERAAGPGAYPRIDHRRAVKKYHRPAAGNEAPLPQDVRPPPVLRRTMDYLVTEILPLGTDPESLAHVHKFIRDRTRAIRQDFTLQNCRADALCVGIHEEMARFHILSSHHLCQLPLADFDPFQNVEQLRKVLQSLMEFYSDARIELDQIRGSPGQRERRRDELLLVLKNEAEFRALHLLAHLPDPEIFRHCFSYSASVFGSAVFQFALACASAYHQSDYRSFFSLLRSAHGVPLITGFLCACLLHTQFWPVRQTALGIMCRAYSAAEVFPAPKLVDWLGFEDDQELADCLDVAGLGGSVVSGPDGRIVGVYLKPFDDLSGGPNPSPNPSPRPRRSLKWIEPQISHLKLSDVVFGVDSSNSTAIVLSSCMPSSPTHIAMPSSTHIAMPSSTHTAMPSSIHTAMSSSTPTAVMPPSLLLDKNIWPTAETTPLIPQPSDSKQPVPYGKVASEMLDSLLSSILRWKTSVISADVHKSAAAERQRRLQTIGAIAVSTANGLLESCIYEATNSIVLEILGDRRQRRLEQLSSEMALALVEVVVVDKIRSIVREQLLLAWNRLFARPHGSDGHEHGAAGALEKTYESIVVHSRYQRPTPSGVPCHRYLLVYEISEDYRRMDCSLLEDVWRAKRIKPALLEEHLAQERSESARFEEYLCRVLKR